MSEVPMQSRPIGRALNVGALAHGQAPASELKVKLEARHFNFYYGTFQALDDITLAMRDRAAARRAAAGRAVLGARPDRHAEDRGAAAGVAPRVHDRDCDAQHAAGRARLG